MTRIVSFDPAKTGLLDRLECSFYKSPPTLNAQVAQLVEHAIENRSVGGSIPPLGTIHFNDIAEYYRALDSKCRMFAMSVSGSRIRIAN